MAGSDGGDDATNPDLPSEALYPGPYDSGIEERLNVFRYILPAFKDERAAAIVAAAIIQARALKEVADMPREVKLFGGIETYAAD